MPIDSSKCAPIRRRASSLAVAIAGRQLAMMVKDVAALLRRLPGFPRARHGNPHERHERDHDLLEQVIAAGLGNGEVKRDVVFGRRLARVVVACHGICERDDPRGLAWRGVRAPSGGCESDGAATHPETSETWIARSRWGCSSESAITDPSSRSDPRPAAVGDVISGSSAASAPRPAHHGVADPQPPGEWPSLARYRRHAARHRGRAPRPRRSPSYQRIGDHGRDAAGHQAAHPRGAQVARAASRSGGRRRAELHCPKTAAGNR